MPNHIKINPIAVNDADKFDALSQLQIDLQDTAELLHSEFGYAVNVKNEVENGFNGLPLPPKSTLKAAPIETCLTPDLNESFDLMFKHLQPCLITACNFLGLSMKEITIEPFDFEKVIELFYKSVIYHTKVIVELESKRASSNVRTRMGKSIAKSLPRILDVNLKSAKSASATNNVNTGHNNSGRKEAYKLMYEDWEFWLKNKGDYKTKEMFMDYLSETFKAKHKKTGSEKKISTSTIEKRILEWEKGIKP